MNWREFHRINSARQQSPASLNRKKNPYTPARSDKSRHENSFVKAESHNGDKVIQNPLKKIKFSYTVTTEWVVQLQKALKQIFKEFRQFCKSIQKEVEKMNSKYRRLTEFYSNNPTLFELVSEASSPKKVDSSRISDLEAGKWSSVTLEREKGFELGLESNWSKILERHKTQTPKAMNLKVNRTQSFNHENLSRENTKKRMPRNSEREPSDRSRVLNKVKNEKLNDSFVELSERLESMRRILEIGEDDFL